MANRRVVVEFLGKDQGLGKTASSLGGHTGKLSAGLGKLAGAFAGLAVIGTATNFLKDSVAEARESQKVNAQTAAVIKSTGGAAGVTAKQFGDLATSISNKTAIDDEQIQAGENMLATFTNVQNRLGKGNDIFTQATKVSTDLAVATGTDQVAANVLLGKALNDPISGIGKLTKIGVTFNDQQKKQIKTMMEAGDVAGAQKVILKELGKEFGGSAAAQATAGEKARASFNNLKESIGTALLPVLDKFFTFLSTSVIPALYKLPAVFASVSAAITPVINWFRALGSGSGEAGGKMSQFRATVASVWASIKSIFASAIAIVKALWGAFGGAITAYARTAFKNVLNVIRGAFLVIQGIFKVVSSLLKGDWKGVWDGIKMILRGAVVVIKALVSQMWALIKLAFRAGGVVLRAIFSAAWTGIKAAARAGALGVVSLVRGLPGRIKSALGNLGSILYNAGRELIAGLIRGIFSKLGELASAMSSVASKVKGFLPGSPVKEGPLVSWNDGGAGKRLVDMGITDGIISRKGAVAAAMTDLTSGATLGDTAPRLRDGGAGGDTYVFNFHGIIDSDAAKIEQMLTRRLRSTGRPLAFT